MANLSQIVENGKGRVAEVYSVFGNNALLLAWPLGSKGGKRRWKHLTLARTRGTKYQRHLAAGNIGIALGGPSGGVCAIDLDTDELRDRFLRENYWAKRTTEVRGARGSKFFVQITGAYPATHHLYQGDQDVAQWLGDGSQAIISGQHPDGMWYQFANGLRPFVLEYADIKWPLERRKSRQAEFTEQKSIRATDANELTSDKRQLEAVLCERAQHFIPTFFRQNNNLLFQLARALVDIERNLNRKLSPEEERIAFDAWAESAKPYWRQGHTPEDYWYEFLDARRRAQWGLNDDPRIGAWEESRSITVPAEACRWGPDERVKRVIALCMVLQRRCGDRSFFAPTRWVAGLLGVSHSQVALWFRILCCPMEVLIRTEPATNTRCPRYKCRY